MLIVIFTRVRKWDTGVSTIKFTKEKYFSFQNGEFQVYTPEHNNLHAENGYLYMKPVWQYLI